MGPLGQARATMGIFALGQARPTMDTIGPLHWDCLGSLWTLAHYWSIGTG